jgi:hypothetical protein
MLRVSPVHAESETIEMSQILSSPVNKTKHMSAILNTTNTSLLFSRGLRSDFRLQPGSWD